jgi:hypothetical protein
MVDDDNDEIDWSKYRNLVMRRMVVLLEDFERYPTYGHTEGLRDVTRKD